MELLKYMEKEHKLLPQINLTELFKILWNRKLFILTVAFISGVIGFVLALDIPKQYRTVVTLAPESSESTLASAASSITSMLGMNLNAPGADAIYPELYPDIINTTPFTIEMMNINVCTVDSMYVGNLYNYLKSHQKSPWWSEAKYKIKSLFQKKSGAGEESLDAYRLTKKQMNVLESFHKKVTCEVDVKTSVITLTSDMQDKQVSCTVADSLCSKLQEYVTAYKTNKAKTDVQSMQRMYDEAKEEYIKAQEEYATFSDRNANLVRERAKSESVRLENEMNMTFGVYQELSTQLALSKAKLQEKTPAFTVLEPARLAEWHFAPKKSIIAVFFAFLGGIGCCVYVYLHHTGLFSVDKHISGNKESLQNTTEE